MEVSREFASSADGLSETEWNAGTIIS